VLDLAAVPVWVWILLGTLLAVGVAGLVFWFAYGRQALARRYLVGLIGRRESVCASRRTLEAIMRHLADESDEALAAFADDPTSEDRRSLAEVRAQMAVLADELDTRPMPSRIVRVAEELADAAFVIAEEAGRVRDEMDAAEVLAALAQVDLSRVAQQADEADHYIDEASGEYGVEDTAVYGGGLYI